MGDGLTKSEREALGMLAVAGLRNGPLPPSRGGEKAAFQGHMRETAKMWRRVFGDRIRGREVDAVVAHMDEPERGAFWPRPADLAKHLPRAAPRPQGVAEDPRTWNRRPFDLLPHAQGQVMARVLEAERRAALHLGAHDLASQWLPGLHSRSDAAYRAECARRGLDPDAELPHPRHWPGPTPPPGFASAIASVPTTPKRSGRISERRGVDSLSAGLTRIALPANLRLAGGAR
mgnify:CR=1 FL=1